MQKHESNELDLLDKELSFQLYNVYLKHHSF